MICSIYDDFTKDSSNLESSFQWAHSTVPWSSTALEGIQWQRGFPRGSTDPSDIFHPAWGRLAWCWQNHQCSSSQRCKQMTTSLYFFINTYLIQCYFHNFFFHTCYCKKVFILFLISPNKVVFKEREHFLWISPYFISSTDWDGLGKNILSKQLINNEFISNT